MKSDKRKFRWTANKTWICVLILLLILPVVYKGVCSGFLPVSRQTRDIIDLEYLYENYDRLIGKNGYFEGADSPFMSLKTVHRQYIYDESQFCNVDIYIETPTDEEDGRMRISGGKYLSLRTQGEPTAAEQEEYKTPFIDSLLSKFINVDVYCEYDETTGKLIDDNVKYNRWGYSKPFVNRIVEISGKGIQIMITEQTYLDFGHMDDKAIVDMAVNDIFYTLRGGHSGEGE